MKPEIFEAVFRLIEISIAIILYRQDNPPLFKGF